jgi:hypothetical protein
MPFQGIAHFLSNSAAFFQFSIAADFYLGLMVEVKVNFCL